MKVIHFSGKGFKGFTLASGTSFIRGGAAYVEAFLAMRDAKDIEVVEREERELGEYMEAYFAM